MNNSLQPIDFNSPNQIESTSEINKVLSAAVVSKNFRNSLLTNPGPTIKKGYGGEFFNLTVLDIEKISMIKAQSLDDFARQLVFQ